jgi:DNA-binding transcriptional MerR regulator
VSDRRPADTARDDLLTIGRFARLAGLSIGALRHYDDLDLLRPARVDAGTGYRSYRHDQLERARMIAALRLLEVPLDEVRRIVDADDPSERRRLLARERGRAHARAARQGRIAHSIAHLESATEEPPMSPPTRAPEIDAATRRALAAGLFNRCWELMEIPDRAAAQDDELVHTAHASRFHWGEIDAGAKVARGEWMCARAYSTLGRAEPALHHARRCLELVEAAAPDAGIEDWDLASAYEGMARATLVAGDRAGAATWRERGRSALDAIADEEDRHIVEQDLDSLEI